MNDERRPLAPAPGLANLPKPPPRPQPSPSTARPTPLRSVDAPPEELRDAPALSASGGGAPPSGLTRETGARTTRRTPQSAPAGRRAATAKRAISFTTPVELSARLSAAATDGRTLADVVLAAVEETEPRLTDLIDAERPPASNGSGLFPDSASGRRRNREPRVVVSLRLSEGNVEVLDQLVVRHQADDRSQLITAALRAAL